MKKTAILLIMLMNVLNQLHSQIPIKGKVIDTDTKEEIPFVNIGIIDLSIGTVSDRAGEFTITANSKEDLITFSIIGYETKNVAVHKLLNKELIQMKSKNYEIETIEVQANRFEEQEVLLGAKNVERGHSIGFGSAQLGTEIGAAIKIGKPTYVKSANFILNHAKGDSVLFRVNLYKFSDGKIGENVLKENILIEEKQRKGIYKIDLTELNLIIESDVLLTLEWLRDYDEIGNKEITFDTKKVKNLRGIYLKYSSNGSFEKLPYQEKLKPCFYLIGKQSKKR